MAGRPITTKSGLRKVERSFYLDPIILVWLERKAYAEGVSASAYIGTLLESLREAEYKQM